MNRTDFCLQRLFRTAASAPRDCPNEAPFPLETKVLAAWRAGLEPEDAPELVGLFRAACFCACAIILITAILSVRSLNESPPNELMVVDSAIQLTLLQ